MTSAAQPSSRTLNPDITNTLYKQSDLKVENCPEKDSRTLQISFRYPESNKLVLAVWQSHPNLAMLVATLDRPTGSYHPDASGQVNDLTGKMARSIEEDSYVKDNFLLINKVAEEFKKNNI